MERSIFKISDYDCIGFDLDYTLARYKLEALVEMEYELLSKFLVQKGYSKKHLMKPIDYDFLQKGLVLDIDKGNVLKLAYDGRIISATHGTRLLTECELQNYYPNSHWKLTDSFVKDPLKDWNGPNSEKMRSQLDYDHTVIGLIFARLVDTKDEETNEPILKYTVFTDIYEGLVEMFTIDNSKLIKGTYYTEIESNLGKYFYRCSQKLIDWLQTLRNQGKLLYLVTSSNITYASSTASYCLGPNWKHYFHIIIASAKKPGFFTSNRDFRKLDGFKETGIISTEHLAQQGVYTHGNWKGLREFLVKHQPKPNPRFLFIGDNLVEDIYTASFYTDCDTVAICEELTDKNHPDDKIINSTFWGSYLQDKQIDTIWYKIIKDHSKVWFSNIDVVVNLQCDKI